MKSKRKKFSIPKINEISISAASIFNSPDGVKRTRTFKKKRKMIKIFNKDKQTNKEYTYSL